MKPRYIKRIIKEDFPPKVQEWIDTLLYPLNQNIEQFNDLFAKNISLADNIEAAFKVLTVAGTTVITGDTTAGSATITNATYYQATINNIFYGVQVGHTIQGIGILPGATISVISGSNITLSQACQYTQKGAEFMVGGNFPISFTHGLKVKPSVVLIVKVEDTNPLHALQTSAFCPQWELNHDKVVIKAIPGLQAGRTYKITFLVL